MTICSLISRVAIWAESRWWSPIRMTKQCLWCSQVEISIRWKFVQEKISQLIWLRWGLGELFQPTVKKIRWRHFFLGCFVMTSSKNTLKKCLHLNFFTVGLNSSPIPQWSQISWETFSCTNFQVSGIIAKLLPDYKMGGGGFWARKDQFLKFIFLMEF